MSTDFRASQCGLPSGVPLLTVDFFRASALPANTPSSDGNTLTANANGALSVDGSFPSAGKLIGHVNGVYGGVYVVVQAGSGGTPWILRRVAAARVGAVVGPALYLRVISGTRYGSTSIRLFDSGTDGAAITVGTSTMTSAMLEDRGLLATFTDGGATPGDVTQNTGSGRAAIAATATTCTVTNSLVTPTSVVNVTLEDLDATATSVKVVPGSGAFVVTAVAAATANTKFRYTVTNTP